MLLSARLLLPHKGQQSEDVPRTLPSQVTTPEQWAAAALHSVTRTDCGHQGPSWFSVVIKMLYQMTFLTDHFGKWLRLCTFVILLFTSSVSSKVQWEQVVSEVCLSPHPRGSFGDARGKH